MPEGVGYGEFADASGILSVAGMVTGAIGAFYAAKDQQYQARAGALSLEFQQNMAALNSRQAELDAFHILEAGAREKGLRTLRYGQIKSSARASQAARGVQAGVGSAAEIEASIDLAREMDSLAMDINTVRAAGRARRAAVDQQNRAALLGVSAANLRGTAGAINPLLSGVTSLLGGAGQVASRWAANKRLERLYGAGRV